MERIKNRKIKISLSELAQSCKQNVTIFEEDMTQKLLMNTKTKKQHKKMKGVQKQINDLSDNRARFFQFWFLFALLSCEDATVFWLFLFVFVFMTSWYSCPRF